MKSNKRRFENLKIFSAKFTRYIGLGVMVLLMLSLLGSISRLKEVGSNIDKEKERINKLKTEQEELRKNLEFAQSEEFIEKQLRDKLGLAKDGEIVVILPDSETVKKFAPRMDEEEKILLIPNWKKWMKLFI